MTLVTKINQIKTQVDHCEINKGAGDFGRLRLMLNDLRDDVATLEMKVEDLESELEEMQLEEAYG